MHIVIQLTICKNEYQSNRIPSQLCQKKKQPAGMAMPNHRCGLSAQTGYLLIIPACSSYRGENAGT